MAQCADCVFFLWAEGGRVGQCRHNAPLTNVGTKTNWPQVLPTDWCGEHQVSANSSPIIGPQITGIAIGQPVTSGIWKSLLFVDSNGQLAQLNAAGISYLIDTANNRMVSPEYRAVVAGGGSGDVISEHEVNGVFHYSGYTPGHGQTGNNYVLNGDGTNFGTLVNVAAGKWAFGVTSDKTVDGTPILTWFDAADGGGPGVKIDGFGQITAVAFAGLPASPVEGMMIPVTNSDTDVWGATITASGAANKHVLAYYDGTNWTVMAK